MKLAIFAVVLLGGCLLHKDDQTVDPTQMEVDQWNSLSAQYDARRTMFLGSDVGDLSPVDSELFWLDTTNFAPALDRYDDTTHTRLAYAFSVGDGTTYNFRASPSYVVTADASSDPVVYRAYDATAAQREVAETSYPQPANAMWNAYAVSDSTVYLVDDSIAGQTALLRWLPGQGDLAQVTTLESAGAQIGEFEDFDVDGNTMVFVAGGALWMLDIPANHATWLMNMTEIAGPIDYEQDGVTFQTASGLSFYDFSRGALVDVSAAIDGNSFQINAAFATASNFDGSGGGFARWSHYVVYIGQFGVFAYDLVGATITPILLSPDRADLRVDYRAPVALADGKLFVTGLTSTDGAIGADGPTYEVDLTAILK